MRVRVWVAVISLICLVQGLWLWIMAMGYGYGFMAMDYGYGSGVEVNLLQFPLSCEESHLELSNL